MERAGFYDAMIVGGGDKAMAYAAFGHFDEAIYAARLSTLRAEHYRRWGRRFHHLVGGNVHYIAGPAYHLWHGALKDRQYLARHLAFAQFDFDPASDLVVGESGCWEWATDKAEMHRFLNGYFRSRNEDNRGAEEEDLSAPAACAAPPPNGSFR
jgi:hypothetical protein